MKGTMLRQYFSRTIFLMISIGQLAVSVNTLNRMKYGRFVDNPVDNCYFILKKIKKERGWSMDQSSFRFRFGLWIHKISCKAVKGFGLLSFFAIFAVAISFLASFSSERTTFPEEINWILWTTIALVVLIVLLLLSMYVDHKTEKYKVEKKKPRWPYV